MGFTDSECGLGHRCRPKPSPNELPAACMGWKRRVNVGKTVAFRSKYSAGRERSNYAWSSPKTGSSQIGLPTSDLFGHWYDLGYSVPRQKHWEDNLKKDTLKPSCSNPVTIKVSVGNVAYITKNAESNNENSKGNYNEYSSTAVFHEIVPPTIEIHLRVGSYVQSLCLVTSRENIYKSCQGLGAQGLVEFISTKLFIVKTASRSWQQMQIPKRMKITTYREVLTSWTESRAPLSRHSSQELMIAWTLQGCTRPLIHKKQSLSVTIK